MKPTILVIIAFLISLATPLLYAGGNTNTSDLEQDRSTLTKFLRSK